MILLQYSIKNAGRITAVRVEPKRAGLTVIGGRNRQGKTTNLDMLCWALGGDRYKPVEPNRRGSATPAEIDIRTDNGLHIERKGKNGALCVTDEKTNTRGSQSLLDKFVTTFALDLPSFRRASAKEKCNILLKTLGVDAELAAREQRIKEAYDHRTHVNRELKQREGALAQVQKPDEPPIDNPIDVNDLVQQLQAANQSNAAGERIVQRGALIQQCIESDTKRIEALRNELANLEVIRADHEAALNALPKSPPKIDTTALQSDIATANQLNSDYAKVKQQRAEYDRVAREAEEARKAAQDADAAVDQARQAKMNLLAGVQMPDPDISVADDGELIYKGDRWDQLADSDELLLCCKIVSKLNPECRFVFVDGLERLDPQTLLDLDAWARDQQLQIIGTRVTTDPGEADLIVEDGEILEMEREAV